MMGKILGLFLIAIVISGINATISVWIADHQRPQHKYVVSGCTFIGCENTEEALAGLKESESGVTIYTCDSPVIVVPKVVE